VAIRAHARFGSTYEGGVSALGSRYLYVGTSTGNTLHVLDAHSTRALAHWRLPTLGNGIAYTMERLRLSPNNRWLYVLNSIRTDLVRIDLTGKQAPWSLNLYPQHNGIPTDFKLSPDGSRLYVMGGAGADVYQAASGAYLGRIGGADAVAPAPNGSVYALYIGRGFARVAVIGTNGRQRLLAQYRGNSLSSRNGDIALSPDSRDVYALWDSLRAFDASSGRHLGATPLPLVPHYNGITLAPNGQEAMIWAPNFGGIFDTPGLNPGYVLRHYGFVAGGVVAIDLHRMRPISANLEQVGTPRQVAYSSDSRSAFVTGVRDLWVIGTGTVGTDRASYPAISLQSPGGGSSGPASPHKGPGSGTGSSCHSWNISGAWQFAGSPAAPGPGSGSGTLQQGGSSVGGMLSAGGVSWGLQGSVQGASVTLFLRAAGQITLTFNGTVAAGGTRINGNLGSFTGGHARCVG
jgi:hypothetical protein